MRPVIEKAVGEGEGEEEDWHVDLDITGFDVEDISPPVLFLLPSLRHCFYFEANLLVGADQALYI